MKTWSQKYDNLNPETWEPMFYGHLRISVRQRWQK
uniref:Uncharacterized protein n=1 Tax=Lepeophtheirus salmonis TaxID=72036 RepID=A0A0K2T0K3_LEPSM